MRRSPLLAAAVLALATSVGGAEEEDPLLAAARARVTELKGTSAFAASEGEAPGWCVWFPARDVATIRDEDLAVLRGFPDLRLLAVDDQPITDAGFRVIAQHTRLQRLYAKGTRMTDAGLAALAPLRSLRAVALPVGKGHVTNGGLATLARFPVLEEVLVHDGGVDDMGLASLAKVRTLRSLRFAGCPITDAGLAHLAALANLRRLAITRAPISASGLKHVAALPLEELDLRGTVLDDRVCDAVKGIATLRRLTCMRIRAEDYEGPGITDIGAARLVALKRLEQLDVSDNPIRGRAFAAWDTTAPLKDVSLCSTALDDAGLAIVARLIHVQSLAIVDTRVGDASIATLAAMPSLRTLVAAETKITPEGLAALRSARPELEVYGDDPK